MEISSEAFRRLLGGLQAGDAQAGDQLLSIIHPELRRIADALFKGQRSDHTLQPTALIHEAYIRLAKPHAGEIKGRAHFLAVAARAMRQIMTDHSRRKQAAKRGGHELRRVSLSGLEAEPSEAAELMDLEQALARLEQFDERMCRIVEMRFLGGLTVEETADLIGVSPRTVKEDWRFARNWLRKEIG